MTKMIIDYRKISVLFLQLALTLSIFIAGAVTAVAEITIPAIVEKCQADLAQRLKLKNDNVVFVDVQAKTWADASLGMPEEGKMYAQMLTPGWRIVLEAKNTAYLYTASDKNFKFGGPVALWENSMLYLKPVEGEANMNSDLYQCSLIGTNNMMILSGVSEYYPQEKGMVLATRRTSRSGFDLISVKAEKNAKEKKLYSAFYIGAAALNDAQNIWAAFVRPGLGTGWNVAIAGVGDEKANLLPLPDGVQPQKIIWAEDMVMIQVGKEKGSLYYEINPKAKTPEWKTIAAYRYPGALDFVLSKSESLEVVQAGTKEKPAVEVATIWFTGDRKVAATIDGLTLIGYELKKNSGYVFITGTIDGVMSTFSVRLSTGAIIPGYHGLFRNAKVLTCPPVNMP